MLGLFEGRPGILAAFAALLLLTGVVIGLVLAPSKGRKGGDYEVDFGPAFVTPQAVAPEGASSHPMPPGTVRMTDPLSANGVASSATSRPEDQEVASAASAVPPVATSPADGIVPGPTPVPQQPMPRPNKVPQPSAQNAGGRPMIAIVIDDMGLDRKRTRKVTELPAPLTTSFLTYAEDLEGQATQARRAGHELFVHVPMEPSASSVDPGPGALRVSMSPEEITKTLLHVLPTSPGFVGINNHMGSRFTEYDDGMRAVMGVLKQRGLMWLDSKTTAHSFGAQAARELGVPYAERTVFIDHEDTVGFVQHQLAEIETMARKHGYVIAIGHPKDHTINGLRNWLPTLKDKGFAQVPVSSIIQAKTLAAR